MWFRRARARPPTRAPSFRPGWGNSIRSDRVSEVRPPVRALQLGALPAAPARRARRSGETSAHDRAPSSAHRPRRRREPTPKISDEMGYRVTVGTISERATGSRPFALTSPSPTCPASWQWSCRAEPQHRAVAVALVTLSGFAPHDAGSSSSHFSCGCTEYAASTLDHDAQGACAAIVTRKPA